METLAQDPALRQEWLDEFHREKVFPHLQAMQKMHARFGYAAVMAGGAPAAVEHPLGPPTLSGNTITVDSMLAQPTRITHMIMDLSLQRFIADYVFSSGGGVTGGAVIYDEVQSNELYLTRDVQVVEPGAEFPLVTSDRLAPKVATPEKWGGKTFITDEARDRNDSSQLTNRLRQLTNTIIRKNNQNAVAKLEAAVTASSRSVSGNDWSAVVTTGSSASNHTLWPAFDFGKAARLAEQDELGIVYDTWLINPVEYQNLVSIYGAGNLSSLLSAMGISLYVSNRVTTGTAYVVAQGQVGQMRIEQPLTTETWRDPNGRQQTWIQSSVRPVMFVENPYAVLKFTGLGG